MRGGLGRDTYVWGKGFGNDIIKEAYFSAGEYSQASRFTKIYTDAEAVENNSSNLFLERLTPRDVEFSFAIGNESNQLLTLKIKSTGETLTFDSEYGLGNIHITWGNGLAWSPEDLQAVVFPASNKDDLLLGFTDISNYIDGKAGRDKIVGGYRDDTLLGGKGNDEIYGNDGDDIIDGGKGRDVIHTGYGSDTLILGKNSNTDVIADHLDADLYGLHAEDENIIKLDANVRKRDLEILRSGDTLIVQIKGTNNRIEADSFFSRIDTPIPFFDVAAPSTAILGGIGVEFADGTVWNADTLAALAKDAGKQTGQTLSAGEQQTTVAGSLGNDKITGNENFNVIYGRAGDDIIDGLGGGDWIFGGQGRDTFIVGRNYGGTGILDASGENVIFKDGITQADVSYRFLGSDLIFQIKDEISTITLSNYLIAKGDTVKNDGTIKFADGTVLTQSQLSLDHFMPSEGDNEIYGTVGDDKIDGLGGNDLIVGLDGNDYLIGGNGDDYLSGEEGGDFLQGGNGSDVLYGGNGGDLLEGNDGIDNISGGDGNDIIRGGEGVDYLDGGIGNDVIEGGGGDDTLVGGYQDYDTFMFNGEFGNDYLNLATHTALQLGGTPDDYQFQLSFDSGMKITKGDNNISVGGQIFEALERIESIYFDHDTWSGEDVALNILETAFSNVHTRGDDVITGDAKNDSFTGGDGNDTMDGADGSDVIYGGYGGDKLSGGSGYDILYGGYGNDTLLGGDQSDFLDGGAFNDILDGGLDSDLYYFKGSFGTDTIVDAAGDSIIVKGSIFDYKIALDKNVNLSITNGDNSITLNGGLDAIKNLGSLSFDDHYVDGVTLYNELFPAAEPTGLVSSTTDAQVNSLINAMAGFSPAGAASSQIGVAVTEITLASLSVNPLS